MKKTIIILSVIIAILAVFGIYLIKQKTTILPIIETNYTGGIKSFSYHEGNGWTYGFDYSITSENNKMKLIYTKSMGAIEQDPIRIEIDEQVLQKLEEIIEENNIKSWDGFSKYNKDVLDGTSRYIGIYYNDGKNISANGYMKWPNGYRDGIDAITSYLDGLLGLNND